MSNPYVQSLNEYRNSLAVDYMPAVKAMAARLKERLPSSIDFNDLVSIGLEELVKLSKRYDPKQNDNFWGYAQKRVYGAMLDFLRSLDTISRADRKLVKEIDKITEEYMATYGIAPSDEYLAEVLNENIEKINYKGIFCFIIWSDVILNQSEC
jgi:RNA polymerase sigma factor for flagellar operon FliA